ncbi:hypothetical protein D3C83_60460 [compost metagenome]
MWAGRDDGRIGVRARAKAALENNGAIDQNRLNKRINRRQRIGSGPAKDLYASSERGDGLSVARAELGDRSRALASLDQDRAREKRLIGCLDKGISDR